MSAAAEILDPQWIAVKKKLAKSAPMLSRLGARSESKPSSRRATTATAPRVASGAGWLIDALPAITPALEQLRAPVDRLEMLERELLKLMATAAPSTWRSSRRQFTRVLRAARREIRTLERRSPIGKLS